MDWIDANGIALRYDVSGSGEPVLVLVHEMGGALESWDHVLPMIATGRRVLRYDMRGHGQSERPVAAFTLNGMIADLLALLDALFPAQPVALAGCAVGAAVALGFAARHPARTAAIVAMSPAVGIAAERRDAMLSRADLVERQGMRAIIEATFAGSYPPEVRHDAGHYRQFRARWLGNDPSAYAATNRMLATMDMQADLAGITCPALVIAGTHDRLRPPETVEPIARAIAGARYQVLETGHYMQVQTPAPVGAAITAFLASRGT